MKSQYIARVGVIAAAYAACTLVTMLFLGSLAWGPIQFRVSEALCVLALFTPAAVPGLTLGCVIANVANIVLSGTGMLGMLDVVFGSLATFLGALFTWKMRSRPLIALAGPVLANALIVPAYLPLLLQGMVFTPFPSRRFPLDGSWGLMYLFGLVTTGAGEAGYHVCAGLPAAALAGKYAVYEARARSDGYNS